MNKLIKNTIVAISLTGSFSYAAQIDISKSNITWKGSKVIGSTHTGQVTIKNAEVLYQSGEVKSGKVVIDMTSITNTDIKDKTWNDKLVGHLKSADFFAVDKFKTAEFKINKVQKASDEHYLIQGQLVIKGKSLPLSLNAKIKNRSSQHQVVVASFKFDRTKYGIKYGSGTFFDGLGDKMIADDVELEIELHIDLNSKVASK